MRSLSRVFFVLGHVHVDGEDTLEDPPRSLRFLFWDLILHRTGHRVEYLRELGRVGRRQDGGGDEKVILFLNHLTIESFLHKAASCRVELDATMLCKELVECGRELIEELESLELVNLVDIVRVNEVR